MNILRTQKLTDLPHLNLYRTHYEDRNGDPKAWVFASRQDPPRLVSGQWDAPDAVVIVPYQRSPPKNLLSLRSSGWRWVGINMDFPPG